MAIHQGFEMTLEMKPGQQTRVRHLVWPREHGAWGMLFVPLATGAAMGLMAGGSVAPLVLLVLAAFALFCLRTPVESLWGRSAMKARTVEERRKVTWYVVVFATVALASLGGLFALGQNFGLVVVGVTAAAAFILQTTLRLVRPRLRMLAQVIGAAGLTSTAVAAYCVVTGHLDWRAVALWAANWIFAGNQIHFVQVRLHSSRLATFKDKFYRGAAFFDGQFVMIGALLTGWTFGFLPLFALAAFVPVFLRGLLWFFNGAQPLSVKRLGFTELAHTIGFGILIVAAFTLSK
jgi:YwiC-like protein